MPHYYNDIGLPLIEYVVGVGRMVAEAPPTAEAPANAVTPAVAVTPVATEMSMFAVAVSLAAVLAAATAA